MIYNIIGLWIVSAILNIVIQHQYKPIEIQDKIGILLALAGSIILAPLMFCLYIGAFICVVMSATLGIRRGKNE
jgi:hypothetical protein